MGFRGSLRRFTMYADPLSPDNVNQSISAKYASLLILPTLDLHHVPVKKSQGSLLFVLIIFIIGSFFLIRSKKALVRDGLWHARRKLCIYINDSLQSEALSVTAARGICPKRWAKTASVVFEALNA